MTYKEVLIILEENSGKCLDNPEEREAIAHALTAQRCHSGGCREIATGTRWAGIRPYASPACDAHRDLDAVAKPEHR